MLPEVLLSSQILLCDVHRRLRKRLVNHWDRRIALGPAPVVVVLATVVGVHTCWIAPTLAICRVSSATVLASSLLLAGRRLEAAVTEAIGDPLPVLVPLLGAPGEAGVEVEAVLVAERLLVGLRVVAVVAHGPAAVALPHVRVDLVPEALPVVGQLLARVLWEALPIGVVHGEDELRAAVLLALRRDHDVDAAHLLRHVASARLEEKATRHMRGLLAEQCSNEDPDR